MHIQWRSIVSSMAVHITHMNSSGLPVRLMKVVRVTGLLICSLNLCSLSSFVRLAGSSSSSALALKVLLGPPRLSALLSLKPGLWPDLLGSRYCTKLSSSGLRSLRSAAEMPPRCAKGSSAWRGTSPCLGHWTGRKVPERVKVRLRVAQARAAKPSQPAKGPKHPKPRRCDAISGVCR